METTLNRASSSMDRAIGDIRAYLASPQGRRARRAVAGVLMVSAPLISRLPVFRASKLGRLVGLAGGTTLIVSAAKWIREWEPQAD